MQVITLNDIENFAQLHRYCVSHNYHVEIAHSDREPTRVIVEFGLNKVEMAVPNYDIWSSARKLEYIKKSYASCNRNIICTGRSLNENYLKKYNCPQFVSYLIEMEG